MGNQLFTTGIVGAGHTAQEAISKLRVRSEKTLRDRKTTPATVNDLAQAASKISESLKAAKQEAGRHEEASRHVEECDQAVVETKALIDSIVERKVRNSTVIELWTPWLLRRQAMEALSALADLHDYPVNPDARLERTTGNLERAVTSARDHQERIAHLRRKRQLIVTDPMLVEIAIDVMALVGEDSLHRDRLINRLPAATANVARAGEALTEKLLGLGSDWDRARLAQFDSSIPGRETIRERSHGVITARTRLETSREKHQQELMEVERQRTSADAHDERVALMPVPPTVDEITLREQGIARLEASHIELAALDGRRLAAEQGVQTLISRRQADHDLQVRMLPQWTAVALPLVAVAALLAAAWMALERQLTTAVALTLVAGMGFWGLMWRIRSVRRRDSVSRERADQSGLEPVMQL